MDQTESTINKIFLLDGTAQNLVIQNEATDFSYFVDYINAKYNTSLVPHLIRGQKTAVLSSFFDEWSAALQFPFYFGENWNAFTDCMRDLPRKTDLSHIFIIANAHQLLKTDDQAYTAFFEIMANLSNELKRINPVIKLKLILQETEENIPELKNKLENFKVNYDIIEGDWLALLSAK